MISRHRVCANRRFGGKCRLNLQAMVKKAAGFYSETLVSVTKSFVQNMATTTWNIIATYNGLGLAC